MDFCLIKKVDTCGYNRFLLCLTFESIVNYLSEIETTPEMAAFSGKALIDQLLVTGDGDNRFISCSYIDGKLDMATARIVIPDGIFRNITTKYLHDNYAYVEYSILTEHQRECIKKGVSF